MSGRFGRMALDAREYKRDKGGKFATTNSARGSTGKGKSASRTAGKGAAGSGAGGGSKAERQNASNPMGYNKPGGPKGTYGYGRSSRGEDPKAIYAYEDLTPPNATSSSQIKYADGVKLSDSQARAMLAEQERDTKAWDRTAVKKSPKFKPGDNSMDFVRKVNASLAQPDDPGDTPYDMSEIKSSKFVKNVYFGTTPVQIHEITTKDGRKQQLPIRKEGNAYIIDED